VMYLGKVVELTSTGKIFKNMLHPYTKALFSAIPSHDPRTKKEFIELEGEMPSPANPPLGCHFHTRCREVMVNCGWSPKDLAGPLTEMFDRTRNPEARDFPEVARVALDNSNLTMDLMFARGVADKEGVLDLLNSLISKERSRKGGTKFGAIRKTSFVADNLIQIALMQYNTPSLQEYSKDHYVSCLIYEKPQVSGISEQLEPSLKESDE
jgi:peptide/nickel transport system ATP-binding protein